MSYPKSFVEQVLDYLDAGHSAREAKARFGVSHESAARWRRQRDGNLRHNGPRPVKYPLETVRMALGLAYGGHGLRLDEVAAMVGASASTISNWKKRYIEGGIMEVPEIDPGEVGHLSPEDMESMGEEELKRYIHELEVRSYVLEGTVRI